MMTGSGHALNVNVSFRFKDNDYTRASSYLNVNKLLYTNWRKWPEKVELHRVTATSSTI